LAGGSKEVTAVELNPLMASTARQFNGNLYDSSNVNLFIEDGTRFYSATTTKYDMMVIKRVDCWAAQLADGYPLSYTLSFHSRSVQPILTTFEGSQRDAGNDSWNFELPRLMPLVIESLQQ
jgi:predicted membrane-bound spermidine synthase